MSWYAAPGWMFSMHALEEAGYAVLQDVLSAAECDDLLGRLMAPDVDRSRAGARHLFSLPFVAELAKDSRLLAIAQTALGRDAVPFRVTLFDKSSDANWSVVWHQDTALPLLRRFERSGWGPWSSKGGVLYAHAPAEALERIVALRVHLDDSLSTNGPLRVLRGTHRLGVLSDEQVAEMVRITDAEECVVARGGVVPMRPLLIHSSPRLVTSEPRRVLHIEYVDSLKLEPGIELAAA